MQVFAQNGLEVGVLVTDRHSQIAKWMRENLPNVVHFYDVWHMAKCKYCNYSLFYYIISAFRKKVEALAQKKECEIVGEWIKSMVNHLYWSATSAQNGDGELILAKWLSLVNHLHNVHSGHGELFPECAHSSLYSHKKKWLKARKLLNTHWHFDTYTCIT